MQPWGDELNAGDREIIIGLPGDGKTTLAEGLLASAWRSVTFTPDEEDFRLPGRLVVTVAELERWPRLLAEPHLKLAVEPRDLSGEGLAREVTALVELAFKARNLILVLDEVGDYRRQAEHSLNRLMRRCRKKGVVPVLISQVATDIPLTCRRVATRVRCLGQHERSELKALGDEYGDTFAAMVAAWKRFEPPVTWRRA